MRRKHIFTWKIYNVDILAKYKNIAIDKCGLRLYYTLYVYPTNIGYGKRTAFEREFAWRTRKSTLSVHGIPCTWPKKVVTFFHVSRCIGIGACLFSLRFPFLFHANLVQNSEWNYLAGGRNRPYKLFWDRSMEISGNKSIIKITYICEYYYM